MSDNNETVTITVDGVRLQAPKGAMLIEVTDQADIHVPRFCYHNKLSVAANCRMCLVEVEKAPKPLPACATPVMDGMVVHTCSPAAREAQKSVMEFLLINHPLDCPICDQGGECELQDLAMGYGNDASQYVETKRVVLDKSIGPLIATELTRCIHCTRCVRFGEEIAGVRELGMTSRGERARIATYMGQAVSSELSGNVIDLCPVGALTAKPSRFVARAWEVVQHPGIAPHDCVGSNIAIHTLRGELIRVVPRDNEEINEIWISDRDRFSYEAVDSDERITTPMIKQDGEWRETDWETALNFAADKLRALLDKHAAADEAEAEPEAETEGETGEQDEQTESADAVEQPHPFATLVSPSATLEEMFLAQKITRALGSNNIDHRLRQADFSDQDDAPVMPWLGQPIAALEDVNAALLIGSNVRKEQPLIAHRLRKAAVQHGAQVHFVNSRAFELNYDAASNTAVAPQHMAGVLAAIAKACYEASGATPPPHLADVINNAKVFDQHRAIASDLHQAQQATVLLGEQAAMHEDYAALRQLAAAIAEASGSVFGTLSNGANASGAWLAGATPHRAAGGEAVEQPGMNVAQMLTNPPVAVMLLNVEPDADVNQASAMMNALEQAEHVIAVNSFVSDALKQVADVILPAAAFGETSGTFVNIEGFWQSFRGAREAKGQSRPAWKILRVLANQLGLKGFDYISSEQLRDELRGLCENIELDNNKTSNATVSLSDAGDAMMRAGDVPIYETDALVRRAPSLQRAADAQTICVRINHHEADRLGLTGAASVIVKQDNGEQQSSAQLDLVIDDSIPAGTVWIPYAVRGNELLASATGAVTLEAVS